jgi:UDP-N-acetylglucosamine:LPS N-acetylglucosamine transferase
MIQKPILVMAGGTGGHVFPALAVAENLRQKGESVVWLGTRSGIEARVVPAADFAIEWLSVQGLRGKGLATLMLAPFRLLRACWQALRVLRRTRPKAVLGMGGFVSGSPSRMRRRRCRAANASVTRFVPASTVLKIRPRACRRGWKRRCNCW